MYTLAGNLMVGDSGRFGGLDTNAQAFITAANITNSTQQQAINTLVVGMKNAGLWNKMFAIYPFVGGTAFSHKFNLKNPLDTNAAFRLTFAGTVTHNANGITGNGVNGSANTFFTPSVNFTVGSAHISTYDRTSTVGLGNYTIGAFSSANAAWISYRDSQYAYLGALQNVSSNGQLGISKLRIATRTATNIFKAFRDGLQVGSTVTANVLTYPISTILILSSTGISSFSDHNIAFSSIGSGLSDSESVSLNTLVNNFQTTLGRQV